MKTLFKSHQTQLTFYLFTHSVTLLMFGDSLCQLLLSANKIITVKINVDLIVVIITSYPKENIYAKGHCKRYYFLMEKLIFQVSFPTWCSGLPNSSKNCCFWIVGWVGRHPKLSVSHKFSYKYKKKTISGFKGKWLWREKQIKGQK